MPCCGLVSCLGCGCGCGCGDGEDRVSSTREREDCEAFGLKLWFDRLLLLKERMFLEDIDKEESESEPRTVLASDESRVLELSILLDGLMVPSPAV